MKLAYFSPLTPQRSGISDYSEELLPHLADDAEITLFVDGFQPMNRELTSRFEVLNYRRDQSLLRRLPEFDAVLYHMGNDHRYHAGIFAAIKRRAGIVVFHDFAFQDFFLGLARDTGDLRVYLDEVESCHGRSLRVEAGATLARGAVPAIVSRPAEFPLNSRLAKSAEGIIVHSEWSRARLAAIAPGLPVARIPMPVKFGEPIDTQRSQKEVRIASFGLITPGKGIEQALRALQKLKRSHRFRYTLVGEPNSFYDVRDLIRSYQMEDRVEITGHVTLDEFKRRINETDIALNIRERTVGETSASLCRLMAAGVCAIVADDGWYSELPNAAVVKIPLRECGDQLLLAYLTRLIEDASLRTRIGENARAYACKEHTLESGAATYLNFIREVIAGRTRKQFVSNVTQEIVRLGITSSDDLFLKSIATEVAAVGLTPQSNGHPYAAGEISPNGKENARLQESGRRTPPVEGVDYKQAAREYLSKITEERRHHLRTKPFYNLANKPAKYKTPAMDEDTHRHFCDFANIAMTLALAPGSRILDVGCGSGWLSEYFARLGYIVKGIDISPDLVEMSRERVARVPYGVDHETAVRCDFEVHDIELSALPEKFDAVLCYDSLHHFADERAVIENIARMVDVGGVLFILEGERPPSGSASEEELHQVMREFSTLESPFKYGYLRQLLEEKGFAITGDYVSVSGLFPREQVSDTGLQIATPETNYHYLACKKVAECAHASTVADSRDPRILRADISLLSPPPERVAPAQAIDLQLQIQNTGDTLWLSGAEPRFGIVMPAVRTIDATGMVISEAHGEPALPHAVAPGEIIKLKMSPRAPFRAGAYSLKLDLVAQHICWFEQQGSKPLLVSFEVID